MPDFFPPDLTDLLRRCRLREPAAQRALYGRYAARMLGVARRYAASVAEAEDVLQDAFVKVFTYLGEFRAEGSLEGWVRRIVVTTALNHWQAGQHRCRQSLLDDVPTGGPVSLLLLDALGRPVRRQHLLAPAGPLRETLAVQGLVPGVYVLQVALPGGTVSKRVVVE